MVKLGKHHPYVTSVPRQNRCATCNIRPRGYQVVHVYGNITSNLTIVDGQELIIDTTVIIDVGVILLIQRGARLTITNTGGLYNNGTLSVETGAVFTNNGTFTNGTPPPIPLLQSQQNMFASTNSSMFASTEPIEPINPDTTYDSMFSLMQYYINLYFNSLASRFGYASSNKYKAIEEDPVSYFFNAGTFVNAVGSICINATNGVISNTGVFNNNGSVDNTGTIDNSGLLDNNNGLINNTGGTINNTGAVTNSGTGAIDGGTYTGPPPSGNPVVPPPPPPPPPSSTPLVGSIFAFGPLPILPVYWADGDINTQPTNLNIPNDQFVYGATSVSATTGRIVGVRQDSGGNITAITWENSESVEPVVLGSVFQPASTTCYSISSDGSTIVGNVNEDALGYDIACIWEVSGNTISPLNLESTDPDNTISSAFTCNSNGSIVYGLYGSSISKWTKLDGLYTRTLVYTPEPGISATPVGIFDENTLCLFLNGGGLPQRYGYLDILTQIITPVVASSPDIVIQGTFYGINTTGTSFYGGQFDFATNPPVAILLQVQGDTISQLPLPSYIGTGAYTDYAGVTVGFF